MATHSSVLAWRIPGTGEPGGLLSMGSYRVGHDWSDLAAAVELSDERLCMTARMSLIAFKLGRRYSLSVVKLPSSPLFDVHFYSLIKRGIHHYRRALAGRFWVLDHVIQGRKRKVPNGIRTSLVTDKRGLYQFMSVHAYRGTKGPRQVLAYKWEQQQCPSV